MVRSELDGTRCPGCKKLWGSEAQFERESTFESKTRHENKRGVGTFWRVWCKGCLKTFTILFSFTPS